MLPPHFNVRAFATPTYSNFCDPRQGALITPVYTYTQFDDTKTKPLTSLVVSRRPLPLKDAPAGPRGVLGDQIGLDLHGPSKGGQRGEPAGVAEGHRDVPQQPIPADPSHGRAAKPLLELGLAHPQEVQQVWVRH